MYERLGKGVGVFDRYFVWYWVVDQFGKGVDGLVQLGKGFGFLGRWFVWQWVMAQLGKGFGFSSRYLVRHSAASQLGKMVPRLELCISREEKTPHQIHVCQMAKDQSSEIHLLLFPYLLFSGMLCPQSQQSDAVRPLFPCSYASIAQ